MVGLLLLYCYYGWIIIIIIVVVIINEQHAFRGNISETFFIHQITAHSVV